MHGPLYVWATATLSLGACRAEVHGNAGWEEEEGSEFMSVLQVTVKVDRHRDWHGAPEPVLQKGSLPKPSVESTLLTPTVSAGVATPPRQVIADLHETVVPPTLPALVPSVPERPAASQPLPVPVVVVPPPPAQPSSEAGSQGLSLVHQFRHIEAGEELLPSKITASRGTMAPSSLAYDLLQMMSTSIELHTVSVRDAIKISLAIIFALATISFCVISCAFGVSTRGATPGYSWWHSSSRSLEKDSQPQMVKQSGWSRMKYISTRTPTRPVSARMLSRMRTISQMQASQADPSRLLLCDPSTCSEVSLSFSIDADLLYHTAGSQDSANIQILEGGSARPVFLASVQPSMLMISPAGEPDQPLASSMPCMTTSTDDGVCHKVEIRGRDGLVWGTMQPIDTETYGIFHSSPEPALTLDADQDHGRLTAKVAGEIVGCAMLGRDQKNLEVGVEPRIDPVLMLTSVLAVVLFDPE